MKKYSVADEANQYVQYDMIQAHTAIPSYSELRLQLLYAVLYQTTEGQQKSGLFSLVTALVQLGMDTHDMIDTDINYLTEEKMRARQMKVLAGDYFSARFYQLLAKAGEIELIGKLSEAVSNVNRHKIMLYDRAKLDQLSSENYLEELTSINSELFMTFTYQVNQQYKQAWAVLLPLVTEFEVIVLELKKTAYADGYAKSYLYWLIKEQPSNEQQTEQLSEKMLIELGEQLKVKQRLIDRLSTKHYQINEYIAGHDVLHQPLQLLKEQLDTTYSKYVAK